MPPGTTAVLKQDVALLSAIFSVSEVVFEIAKALPSDKLELVEPLLKEMTRTIKDAETILVTRVRALEQEHGDAQQ